MTTIFVNLLLALAWTTITGSFTLLNGIFGFVLGGVALTFIRNDIGSVTHFRRFFGAVALMVIFLWELIKSSFEVALIVLNPWRTLQPSIIAMPLDLESDAEITLLANLITLTPGTLSMDVSDDGKTLYVHAIDAPDPDAVIAEIKSSFERRIKKVFTP